MLLGGPVVTRFAPSPTGDLHLGHAYAAWVAWSHARNSGGRVLLRWEDIDVSRCRPEYEARILEDLEWLGLTGFETPFLRQSERLPAYGAALDRLAGLGLLYPCVCTRREIQDEIGRAGSAPHGPEGAVYPGRCRQRPEGELFSDAAAVAYRLKMDLAVALAGPLIWEDLQLGGVPVQALAYGDIVLARKEIPTSYHLAVTVDDAAQGITLVTRGEDLVEATSIHRLLQALLGLPVPAWYHHRLIRDEHGRRLATRDRARSLKSLREQGATPASIWKQLGVKGPF